MRHCLLFLALCSAGALLAATVGTDSAANYAADGFTNGANQGTGFQAWNIFKEGDTAKSGYWIGSSTDGCGDINTAGQSFGLWGNSGSTTAFNIIHCYRKFASGALGEGQKFSIILAVNWRNGFKGLDIFGSGTNIFNVNVGGDKYMYRPYGGSDTDTGWGWAGNSVITGTFVQKAGNVLNVTLQRNADIMTQDFSLPASADEFHLYCGNTDSGNANNFFANSMAIIPEPASLLVLALGVGLLVRARR